MSTISSVSSSSNWSAMQSMRRPPDGGKKMAEDLFAQLDTSNQGYIDKSTLQAALDKVSSSSSSTSADELFSKLDSNSDGKVTKQEFADTLQQLESQLQANANLQSGGMPPPPPGGSGSGAGFTKEELTAQLNEIGSSDSKRSSLISSVVSNFDEADSNSDGKVSLQEAMAFQQSNSADSTASTSSSSTSSDSSSTVATSDTAARILQQIMLLMQAYNTDDKSNSSTLSLLA